MNPNLDAVFNSIGVGFNAAQNVMGSVAQGINDVTNTYNNCSRRNCCGNMGMGMNNQPQPQPYGYAYGDTNNNYYYNSSFGFNNYNYMNNNNTTGVDFIPGITDPEYGVNHGASSFNFGFGGI